jgi:predicted ATP-dependent serine protease
LCSSEAIRESAINTGPAGRSGSGRVERTRTYVSAEESAQQIRLGRIVSASIRKMVLVLSGTDLDEILASANAVSPSLLM